MRVKKDFQIYQKQHRSGNPGWIVSLGNVNGKRKFRSFRTREEAELFKAKCFEKSALNNPVALSDMSELGRAHVRLAIEKLKPFGADLGEAVEFFIKFAKPPKGKITIQEAIELFETVKRQDNRSEKYVKTASRCFFAPFRDAFKNRVISDVTPIEAESYIKKNPIWNFTTRNTHNRHLRALYQLLIRRGHATQNPFVSVDFVNEGESKVGDKIISVDEVKALLQYALNRGYKAECACMVLVFFCGVRVEEVGRLSWDRIHLEGADPVVDIKRGKNGKRRVNPIPPNAVHWLILCRSQGNVAPMNYVKRMQRLRRKAGVKYPQNAARHCFASYHVAHHQNATQTAFLLGHPNPTLLYNTYQHLVLPKEAQGFWKIVPDSVLREEMEREAEREFAEALLNNKNWPYLMWASENVMHSVTHDLSSNAENCSS